ncbi:MAG: glycosyltransferase family 9 protein [Burkholderiaceae bacterium]
MPSPSAVYLRLPNWIGDVCMSLPSLEAVIATGQPVVVCARGWARDLLAGYPLAGFIEMHGQWRRDRAAVSEFRKQAHHLRPVGLLLPDSLSSALVFRFAGVPAAGYRDDARGLLLRWPVRKPKGQRHAVESWLHLTTQALERWSLPVTPPTGRRHLNLAVLERHEQQALDALEGRNLPVNDFILIAPTATGLHKGRVKVWPHFDALTRRLQANGYPVAMCPPPSEQQAAKIAAPTAINLPALKLGAFAALTRQAKLVVCNDSGVSHLAAAAGANQLTLFGVTHPDRTGPWSETAVCLGTFDHWPSLEQVYQQVIGLLQPSPTHSGN